MLFEAFQRFAQCRCSVAVHNNWLP